MKMGLRETLGLPEARDVQLPEDAARFRDDFRARMAEINSGLRSMAATVPPNEFAKLAAQRDKLVRAYQQANSNGNGSVSSQSENQRERVLSATDTLHQKVVSRSDKANGRKQSWESHQDDLDTQMATIAELEDAGHPQAPKLRKVGEAIQQRADSNSFDGLEKAKQELGIQLEGVVAWDTKNISGGVADVVTAAGDWLDKASQGEPPTEKDWAELQSLFMLSTQTWCTSMGNAVQGFEKEIESLGVTPDKLSLPIKVIDDLLGDFIPAQIKTARKIAEPILAAVLAKLKKSTVSLRRFCAAWENSFENHYTDTSNQRGLFASFRSDLQKTYGNRLTEKFVRYTVENLPQHLPNHASLRKKLLRLWIDSSVDSWDPGSTAGILHVSIHGVSNLSREHILEHQCADDVDWSLMEAFIDDAQFQPGVLAMLQREYPNERLENLPLRVSLKVSLFCHNPELRHMRTQSSFSGGRTHDTKFEFKSGNKSLYELWKKAKSKKAHPTVNELQPD